MRSIHKVIVLGGGDKKKFAFDIGNDAGDGKWQHDKYRGPLKSVETFRVFVRNVHPKVNEQDLLKIISEIDLLGMKVIYMINC
jgi:hypothetical protein